MFLTFRPYFLFSAGTEAGVVGLGFGVATRDPAA